MRSARSGAEFRRCTSSRPKPLAKRRWSVSRNCRTSRTTTRARNCRRSCKSLGRLIGGCRFFGDVVDGQAAQIGGEEQYIHFATLHAPLEASGKLSSQPGRLADGLIAFYQEVHIPTFFAVIDPRAKKQYLNLWTKDFDYSLAYDADLLCAEAHQSTHSPARSRVMAAKGSMAARS